DDGAAVRVVRVVRLHVEVDRGAAVQTEPLRPPHGVDGRGLPLLRDLARSDPAEVALHRAGRLAADVDRQQPPAHTGDRAPPGGGEVAIGAGPVDPADVDADGTVR